MRIQKPDFTIINPPVSKEKPKDKGLDFVDTLKDAIDSTNTLVKQSEQAALDLSSGKSPNVHEAMIAMQKADIALRLLVKVTSKIIEGYNTLNRLS
ncbi:MAG TPA: flagellar hook-basal body complex protein FliE [Desulfomonilia bacterium]|nr:flagellar hook-basal body complex protein FliE [Desulfomonilia bacterium]